MWNPLRCYLNWIRGSVNPKEATHTVSMDIVIKKGEKTGKALVPCSIYTLSHEIDLNPTLVVKKTGEVKKVPLGRAFSFHPDEEELRLENGERIAWQEEERCPHCNRKIVIAEVAETRYLSCPEIRVSLSDPVPEDVRIPAKFGIRVREIHERFLATILVDALLSLALWLSVSSLWYYPFASGLWVISIVILGLLYLPRENYRMYKLWNWWRSMNATLQKVKP